MGKSAWFNPEIHLISIKKLPETEQVPENFFKKSLPGVFEGLPTDLKTLGRDKRIVTNKKK